MIILVHSYSSRKKCAVYSFCSLWKWKAANLQYTVDGEIKGMTQF